eukprot:m.251055 g.251055  ORF g.251055 m.251055 type:complete len:333 (-) comp26496_c0_seq1:2379-3377(-)
MASISVTQLQAVLDQEQQLVLCDVRSSSSYNKGHIRGAFSLACSSLHARRLARGKGHLQDLVPSHSKAAFNTQLHRGGRIVIYDDRSTSVTAHGSNPLHLFRTVLNNHTSEGEDVCFLRGGYTKFAAATPHLCQRPTHPIAALSLQLPTNGSGHPPAMLDLSSGFADSPRFRDGKRSTVFDTPPTMVFENLLLGGQKDADDLELLKKLGVSAVLNVTPDPPTHSHGPDICYKQLPILDTWHQNVSSYFDETFDFIEAHRGKGSVLVHCRAGISRSPTIVMAYLMKKNNWTLDMTYSHVRQSRGIISPNLDFMGHLHELERLLGEVSSRSSEE